MHFDDKKLRIYHALTKFFTVLNMLAIIVAFVFYLIVFTRANNSTLVVLLFVAAFISLSSVWLVYVANCCLISHWFDTKLIRNKLYNVSNKELADDLYDDKYCAQFENEGGNNIDKNEQGK